jgi:hypothetical protein
MGLPLCPICCPWASCARICGSRSRGRGCLAATSCCVTAEAGYGSGGWAHCNDPARHRRASSQHHRGGAAKPSSLRATSSTSSSRCGASMVEWWHRATTGRTSQSGKQPQWRIWMGHVNFSDVKPFRRSAFENIIHQTRSRPGCHRHCSRRLHASSAWQLGVEAVYSGLVRLAA